jgi:hypothetical protein
MKTIEKIIAIGEALFLFSFGVLGVVVSVCLIKLYLL